MLGVIDFLIAYKIDHVTQGSNVSRNNVNISCPFCGVDDPSHHLGIALDWSGWGCWRNANHRGRSPYRLVSRLLGVSTVEARRILMVGNSAIIDDSDFVSKIQRLNGSTSSRQKVSVKTLSLPAEYKPVSLTMPDRFKVALAKRGYTTSSHLKLLNKLEIGYCSSGVWANRILFPIYQNGLQSWTARSIYDKDKVKYLTLKDEHALRPLKELVWPYELVNRPGRLLILVEGVFDALRIIRHFDKYRIRGLCGFGKVMTRSRAAVINRLANLYDNTLLLLDQDTWVASDDMNMVDALGFVPSVHKIDGSGKGDPGDMQIGELARIIKSYI